MFSATTYSNRSLHPHTQAWLDAGANADGATIARINDTIFSMRDARLLWNGTSGLVRLNLFAGKALDDAIVPQIAELGGQYETNYSFVDDDFRNNGPKGGITKSSTKYLDTGLNANLLDQSRGSLGVILSSNWTPAGTEAFIGSRTTTSYTVVRGYNSGTPTLSTYWGGTNQPIASGIFPIAPGDVIGVWSYGETASEKAFKNKSYGSGATPAIPTHAYPLLLFVSSNSGVLEYHMAAGTSISAYYIWLGESTSAQRDAIVDILQAYNEAMGRG